MLGSIVVSRSDKSHFLLSSSLLFSSSLSPLNLFFNEKYPRIFFGGYPAGSIRMEMLEMSYKISRGKRPWQRGAPLAPRGLQRVIHHKLSKQAKQAKTLAFPIDLNLLARSFYSACRFVRFSTYN